MGLGTVWIEGSVEVILEGEVHSLGGEVSDNVGHVSSPKGDESLFLVNSGETISNAFVSFLDRDVLVGILDLEQELDSFDGSDNGLGNCCGNSSNHEISKEMSGVRHAFSHCFCFFFK